MLQEYNCHKTVQAGKIEDIKIYPDITIIVLENDSNSVCKMCIVVDEAYINKHKPEIGGYFVVYKDGYRSYLPAKSFEEGYTKVLPLSSLTRQKT